MNRRPLLVDPAGGGGCQPRRAPAGPGSRRRWSTLLRRHRSQDRPGAPAWLCRPGCCRCRRRPGRGVVGQALFPPVVRQQVIEHVVDGDGAEQVLLVVHDRRADQVVGREEPGDVGECGVRRQLRHLGVDGAGHQFERRLAQQPLGVHAADVAAGRGGLRRPADEHHRGQRGGEVGGADPGQRLGNRRVWAQHHRLRRHQAAGGVGRVLQQPADRSGFLRFHQAEQSFLDAVGQLGQQVGGVVRVHGLEDVRRAGLVEVGQQLLLVVLRQFLQHVGQPVVVEHVGHLVPQFGVQLAQDAGGVGGAQTLEGGEHLLRTADRVAGQLGRVHAADIGPGHHLHRCPAADPAGPFAHGEPGDHPVPGPGPFHRRVDDDRRARRGGQLNLGAEQLADQPQLQRALLEPAHADRTGGQRDGVRFQAADPEHRHEDRPAGRQLDDQAERSGRFAVQPQRDHDVAHLADRLPTGSEHRQPVELRDEDSGVGGHEHRLGRLDRSNRRGAISRGINAGRLTALNRGVSAHVVTDSTQR